MNTNDFSNIKLVPSLDENINTIKNIFINDTTVILLFGESINNFYPYSNYNLICYFANHVFCFNSSILNNLWYNINTFKNSSVN